MQNQKIIEILETINNLDSKIKDKILLQCNLTDGDFRELHYNVVNKNFEYYDILDFAYSSFKDLSFSDRKDLIQTFREEHKDAKQKERTK